MISGAGDGGHRVEFDNSNNVYIAGWMNGTATFGTITRTANSTTADVFLAKFNNNLTTCAWALNFGGTGSTANNICAGLSVDQENNPIITGQLYGTNANVNPLGTTALNLSSVGNNDCFVIKYKPDGTLWENTVTGLSDFNFQNKIFIYPNPTSNFLYFNSDLTIKKVEIFNLTGQKLIWNENTNSIDVSDLTIGTYIMEVTEQTGKKYQTKFLKN
jgi:hypothetical protein